MEARYSPSTRAKSEPVRIGGIGERVEQLKPLVGYDTYPITRSVKSLWCRLSRLRRLLPSRGDVVRIPRYTPDLPMQREMLVRGGASVPSNPEG